MNRIIQYPDVFGYLCQFVDVDDMVNFLKCSNPGYPALVLLEKKDQKFKEPFNNTPKYYFKCDCGKVCRTDKQDPYYESGYLRRWKQFDSKCHDCKKHIC